MLWQGKQNILPDIRRQVNEIARQPHSFFAIEAQKASPICQNERSVERLQAPDTVTIKIHRQMAFE